MMKKVISLILASCIVLSVFAACSKNDTDSSSDDASNSAAYDVAAVAEEIEKAAPVANAGDIDEDYLAWLGIDSESYDAYAGKYCTITPGVSIVAVVQATDGHADEVKSAFERRRDAIVGEQRNYDEVLSAQAENGRIVVKGNYVVFVISGNSESVDDIESDYASIDTAIDKAFN